MSRRKFLRIPKLSRVWVVSIAGLALLLGGGWFWLKDSSLVQVEEVKINGVHSAQAPAIEAALRAEAKEMTTLHIRKEALQKAVARYPSVASLSVQRHLPHKLTITVNEHKPIAVAVANGNRIPVTSTGLLLHGLSVREKLPEVYPKKTIVGKRITDRQDAAVVSMLASAPEKLRDRIGRGDFGPQGLTADLTNGPRLLFGTPSRLSAKWEAATRVLAEQSAVGAHYVDVRLPERAAVGGVISPEENREEQTEQTAKTGNPQR